MKQKNKAFPDNYFQGILQLRNTNKKLLEFVKNQIKKENNPNVYISKTAKVKGGTDLYLTSNKFLRKIAKKLKKEFTGKLKESENLFSRDAQTGKNIYRLNVLFRQLNIKRGDIITYRGEKVKITEIRDKIQAKNIKTGKRVYFNLE